MTKPSFPPKPVYNFRGRVRAKMYRLSGNTGGAFGLGVGWGNVADVVFWVNSYPTEQWVQLEAYVDKSDSDKYPTPYIYLQPDGSSVALTGGNVWLADLEFLADNPAHVTYQNSMNASYVPQPQNVGQHVFIATGGVSIYAGNSMSWPIGGKLEVINNSGVNQTITQGSGVTLRLAGSATTGNRTLAQRGIARLMKVGADEWIIDGTGVT